MSHLERITSDPQIFGGRPCIRGQRIRVTDIRDLLAGGASRAGILADYPYLQDEDITPNLRYVRDMLAERKTFRSFTRAAKDKWRLVLELNHIDCTSMRCLVKKAAKAFAPRPSNRLKPTVATRTRNHSTQNPKP